MRILYFSRDYTTHDRRFVSAMTDWGAKVAYLRLEDDGVGYVRDGLPAGADWITWSPGPVTGPPSLVGLLPAVGRIIDEVHPDVIHAGPVQTCGLLAVLAGVRPTVVASWGSDVLVQADRDAWNRWATARALRGADAFLCDSIAVLERARAFADLPDERVACFPWGLDLDVCERDAATRARMRAVLGWQDAIVAISTRAWHPEYRILDVVEGFAAACVERPSLRLVLAGAGAEAGAIEARLAGDPQLAGRVHLPGMVAESELRQWFMAADIYVSATPSDGTSISLLEAMAFALPVVVVDNAGNRAWVREGEHGWLVPARDVTGIRRALVAAASESGMARAMGERGRVEVLARADWRRNVTRLFALFERVVTRGS